MSDIILGNLYDINKKAMKQVKPYDPFILNQECKKIAKEIWNTDRLPSYWMLLCRERNDYTIFLLENSISDFKSALIDCFNNRGKVLDITKQPDNNYEIWIRDFDTKENVAYYLFDYNSAIIEV